jgi:hypothetical protein
MGSLDRAVFNPTLLNGNQRKSAMIAAQAKIDHVFRCRSVMVS